MTELPPGSQPSNDEAHVPWEFGPSALIPGAVELDSSIRVILRPNFFPFARELDYWLRGWKWNEEADGSPLRPLTNPFWRDALILSQMFRQCFNDLAAHGTGPAPSPEAVVDFDIRTVRLSSELVSLATRFSEAALRQLFSCTDLHFQVYRRATLGRLISHACRSCKEPHRVSLTGSLAHRYQLCGMFEDHLRKDLERIWSIRNETAAHGSVGPSEFHDAQTCLLAPRRALEAENQVRDRFVHILDHFAQLEAKMMAELGFPLSPEPSTD